jgi:hypothetical protein
MAWPSPRFTDNGNQTVSDNLTNLMWIKDGSTPTVGSCTGSTLTWQQALNYVSCLNTNNYLGHNDWRLPNNIELRSLNDYSQYNPALQSGNPFSNVQSGFYWSSTSYASGPAGAWFVGMLDGFVFGNGKPFDFYVWPVRGGQSGSLGYSISGTITYNGTPIAGATVTLGGAGTGTTITDSSGNYTFNNLPDGSYTVTASKTGYTFGTDNVTINNANSTGDNLSGTLSGGGGGTTVNAGYNPQWLGFTLVSLMLAGGVLLRRKMAEQ